MSNIIAPEKKKTIKSYMQKDDCRSMFYKRFHNLAGTPEGGDDSGGHVKRLSGMR